MEHGPSWEADIFPGVKNLPAILEPEFSLPHSQKPTSCSRLQPDQSSTSPPILSLQDLI
jgi:hypothetical protein